MGAVQDAHLALAVGRHVRRPGDVQSRRHERQLGLQRPPRFDHPRVEDLAGDQQVVLVTELAAEVRGLVLRITGDDAIDQRVGEEARLVDPALERVAQLPVAGGLAHARLDQDIGLGHRGASRGEGMRTPDGILYSRCRRSSVVEQLFRKQQVEGSNPPVGSRCQAAVALR